MRSKSRVWLSAFLLICFCAIIPSGRLYAQQTAAAQASSDAIDQLTGPIALYPDALVFQILEASTNVDTLDEFAGWMRKNVNLKGSNLQDAAQKAGFDASLVALAPFPQVIDMMVQSPDWTKALGQAFTADMNGVFDSIQRMRMQAQAAGNLKTTSQQQVVTQTTSEGQQVIVIQPANPQVIYVPSYDPQTVYVAAPPPPSGVSATGAALIGFTAGVIIGANNSYYHGYDDRWENREDYYQNRQQQYQSNQNQRQTNAQSNQNQRQSTAQGNQSQRQSTSQANQDQRQSNQSQRQASAQTNQNQRSIRFTLCSISGGRRSIAASGQCTDVSVPAPVRRTIWTIHREDRSISASKRSGYFKPRKRADRIANQRNEFRWPFGLSERLRHPDPELAWQQQHLLQQGRWWRRRWTKEIRQT